VTRGASLGLAAATPIATLAPTAAPTPVGNAGANSATHASANARGSSLAAPHAGPWAARRPRGARAVDVRRRLQQHVRDPSAIRPELAGHSLGQRHDALHFATNRLLLGLAMAVARSRDEAPRAEHSL
jgi:hypothetical protein